MPETSIIIRAFNEAAHLPRLFDALATQDYTDFETIVVDSGSFDGTRAIAEQRADRLVRIQSSDFTFGYSLNAGIRQARGGLMAIVSAHAYPVDGRWLGRLVAPLRDAQTAMVYGRQRGVGTSKFGERIDFERLFGARPAQVRPTAFFANNANSAVRRDLWEQYEFDEALPGLEDIDWAKHWAELGYQVVYEPEACIYHVHAETWPQVRRRYHREAFAARWIGVRRRWDIPAECAREARSLAGDTVRAAASGELRAVPEIVRFRYEKLRGTIGGLCDATGLHNPVERDRLLFDRRHRAVVIQGPGRAAMQDVQLRPLAPGEVLVRVAYQGVCHTDLEILDGTLGYYKTGLASYPIVPGHEFSGTVAAIGSRVSDVREGDRVVVECIQGCGECVSCSRGDGIGCAERREVGVIGTDGGYAEFVIASARFLHRVPAALPLKQACLCEPLAVCMKGLRRLEAGWRGAGGPHVCAVIGGGPIGHLMARLLAHHGHVVTVFDRDPERLAAFGGSVIRTSTQLENLATFDTIVEATGNPDALEPAVEGAGTGACILLLGLPYGRRELNVESLVGFDKVLIGSVGSEKRDFAAAIDLMAHLEIGALTAHTLPFPAFRDAWQAVRGRAHLKVILEIDPQADRVAAAAPALAAARR